jgi:hypothetical protein
MTVEWTEDARYRQVFSRSLPAMRSHLWRVVTASRVVELFTARVFRSSGESSFLVVGVTARLSLTSGGTGRVRSNPIVPLELVVYEAHDRSDEPTDSSEVTTRHVLGSRDGP